MLSITLKYLKWANSLLKLARKILKQQNYSTANKLYKKFRVMSIDYLKLIMSDAILYLYNRLTIIFQLSIVGLSLSEDIEYKLLELGCYAVCSCGLKHFIQETNHCFHSRNELVPTIKTPLLL